MKLLSRQNSGLIIFYLVSGKMFKNTLLVLLTNIIRGGVVGLDRQYVASDSEQSNVFGRNGYA